MARTHPKEDAPPRQGLPPRGSVSVVDAGRVDWEDLRYFLAALEVGSLSRAADALGVAQATMSRRVAGLEERIGHALFDRSRTGLEPTAVAWALRPHAEAMAEAAIQAEAALAGLEARPTGVVRLAVPPGIATDLVPPILPALRRRYPDLRLDVLSDNRALDLTRREADIALRSLRPAKGDLVFRALPPVRAGVFVSPGYRATLPARPRHDEIEWLQYSEELLHIPLAQWVETRRGARPPAMTSNSFLALRAAALAGVGAMVLPLPQGRQVGLVEVEGLCDDLPPGEWYLVTLAALRKVPRVAAVVDFIVEAVEASFPDGEWPPPGFGA